MAILTQAQMETLVKELLQANTATNPPFTSGTAGSELEDALNDAYRVVWMSSGGSTVTATHATLWTPSPAVTGTQTLTGALTSVSQILHLYVGTTSGSTGDSTGDTELGRVELSELKWWRANSTSTGLGVYAESKIYAVRRVVPATAADNNKLTVELWPASAGTRYYPAMYVPQFSALSWTGGAGSGANAPDVFDSQSYDIAYMAAIDLAPRIGRSELAIGLDMRLSEATQEMLKRKAEAMVEARQDS